MLWLGFNYLSDEKLSLVECLELKNVLREHEIKLQRFQKLKKGNKEVPSLSYFKIPNIELNKIELDSNLQYTAKNIANQCDKLFSLGSSLIEPLTMKILFAKNLEEKGHEKSNLLKINRIMLKAKSVFIHLSAADTEDSNFTMKFIKEYPFNSFIPDVLNFLTIETASVSKNTLT